MGKKIYHSTCRLCGKARSSFYPGRGVCFACRHEAEKSEAQDQDVVRPNQEQGEPDEQAEGGNNEDY